MGRVLTALRLLRHPTRFVEVVEEKLGASRGYFYRSIRGRITLKYRERFGVDPDLRHPSKYTEKAQWRKLYCPQVELFGSLADKYMVYDHVKERVGSEHLVPVLWCGDDISEELIRSFGDGIVLKPTHRSGQVVFIERQDAVRHDVIVDRLRTLLRWPYSMVGEEPWYGRVRPRVMVQPILKSPTDSEHLDDLKFHVFAQPDGSQKVISYLVNANEHWLAMFDEDFRRMDFDWHTDLYPPPLHEPQRPDAYEDMLRDAKRLAEGIDYVRVDFMVATDNYYFTELTFTPTGGRPRMSPPEWDLILGDYWHLNTGNAFKRLYWLTRTWLPLWRTERPMRVLRRLASLQSEINMRGLRPPDYLGDLSHPSQPGTGGES